MLLLMNNNTCKSKTMYTSSLIQSILQSPRNVKNKTKMDTKLFNSKYVIYNIQLHFLIWLKFSAFQVFLNLIMQFYFVKTRVDHFWID